MLGKMVIPGERITEKGESEETDDPENASIVDTDSSDITASSACTRIGWSGPSSPGTPPSGTPSPITAPLHTRPYGKAKKTKDR